VNVKFDGYASSYTSKMRDMDTSFERRLQLAGLAIESTLSANLSVVEYKVPSAGRVVRRGDLAWLEWDTLEQSQRKIEVSPGTCLREFLSFGSGQNDPERVLDFAETYGVLYVCDHVPPARYSPEHVDFDWNCPKCDAIGRRAEPLHAWTYYASSMRAVVGLASDLLAGYTPDSDEVSVLEVVTEDHLMVSDDLIVFDDFKGPDVPDWTPETIDDVWALIYIAVDCWLANCVTRGHLDVSLAVNASVAQKRESGRPVLEATVYIHSLLGLLAVELLATLTSEAGPCRCSICGTPFIPGQIAESTWKVRKGSPRFCSSGCRTAGKRRRQNAWTRGRAVPP